MCSITIDSDDDSFLSEDNISEYHAEAVNFDSSFIQTSRNFATCRSGQMKSLSLDKLNLSNPALDSIVTKSLLELTSENIICDSENKKSCDLPPQDSTDLAQLSATILGNMEYRTSKRNLTLIKFAQSF